MNAYRSHRREMYEIEIAARRTRALFAAAVAFLIIVAVVVFA